MWKLFARQRGAAAVQAAADPRATAQAALSAGIRALDEGRLDEACRLFRAASEADPKWAIARVTLGYVLRETGDREAAHAQLLKAVELDPDNADAHYMVALALIERRHLAGAILHLERAISIAPAMALAYRDLGKAMYDSGQSARAKEVLRAGIAAAPGADLYQFLGNVQAHELEVEAALASYRKALEIDPNYAVVYSNMAPVLAQLSQFESAADAARKALAIDPTMISARSNLLLAMSADPRCPPEQYLAEARRFGAAADADAGPYLARRNARPAEPGPATMRPLRVGFVSGDLRRHPTGYFLDNVLAHWDREPMPIVAYSNDPARDDMTRRLQSRCDDWRDIAGMKDDEVAAQIEADRIDMLVDLSGPTPGGRLLTFARRPAPVQVAWLGYWASTGLRQMDYIVADPVSVPVEHYDQYVETVWPLPKTRLCFTPPSGEDVPQVAPTPALTSGHVTFGSFQRLTKLNDGVLALWARVLHAVPGSRLRLQAIELKDAQAAQRMLERLAGQGIAEAQVELVPGTDRIRYLAAHAQVDILLDTFPHSGATTTCEALWMGVPTVTLAGSTMLARQGASLMAAIGLDDWISTEASQYVSIAMRHAADIDALARLRASLRERVAASPVFDGALFARELQQALREMWLQRKCPDRV